MELTITKIGDESCIILPQEVLDRLNLHTGDTVQLTDTPEGLTLSPREDDVEETMRLTRQVMKEDHALLSKLAE